MILIVPATAVVRSGEVVNGNVVPDGGIGINAGGVVVFVIDGIELGNPVREVAPGTRAAFSDAAFVTEAATVASNVTGASLASALPADWHYPDENL